MKITVHTRSCNADLYAKMRSFIPEEIECFKYQNYNDWTDAIRILHDLIENNTGIILLCDEDNFIVDWREIERIAEVMSWNDILFSGVPDGGMIPHRSFSWATANPFMLFINCDLVKDMKRNFSREEVNAFQFNDKMNQYKPELMGAFNNDHVEPFNGLFYWMLSIGRPLYLKATTMGDGISSEVKGLGGKVISYHSWLSRDASPENLERINKLCSYAKKFLPL